MDLNRAKHLDKLLIAVEQKGKSISKGYVFDNVDEFFWLFKNGYIKGYPDTQPRTIHIVGTTDKGNDWIFNGGFEGSVNRANQELIDADLDRRSKRNAITKSNWALAISIAALAVALGKALWDILHAG